MPYIEAVTRWACWFITALGLAQGLSAETRPDTTMLASHLGKVRGSLMLTGREYGRLQAEYLKWIDARVKTGIDVSAMNEELRAAGLFYTWGDYGDEMFKSHAGYVEDILAKDVAGAGDLLVLTAQIYAGYGCSINDTVVLYDRRSLERVAAINAAPPAAKGGYWYRVSAIDVGSKNEAGARLVATGWIAANCTSNWNGTAIRVDRISGNSVRNVLHEDLAARNEDGITPSIDGDTVTFRYVGGIFDSQLLSVPALRRYHFTQNGGFQREPFALTRAGFLREWLDGSDPDVASWSEASAVAGRKAAVSALKNNSFEWVRIANCGGTPELWELAIQPYQSKVTMVFRMSGSHATELKMVAVTDRWTESCTAIDIHGDLSAIGAELH